VRALSNGLDEGRVHHAFLFTGTRGVGKTTIARILAKSLNCTVGVSSGPCGECEHCMAIDEGRFVDLLEIDAASRTRVDDTREILDNVPYAPARGRFKVYLIDEVHMLSTHSFNALLKTLEEPPEHVKFVLATTDPQKIPVTILSRCMQFNLRRLEVDEIAGKLKSILEAERIEFEPAAVTLLARAADGSMRDGLSLLDQALAAASGTLDLSPVEEMLGSVEQRHLNAIVEALIEGDAAAALAVVGELFSLARDLSRLLDDLAELLHRVALLQQVPDYRDESRTDWEQLAAWARRLDPEDVQLYYQIATTGRRDLGLAPSPRTGCEMTLLRMFAFRPAGQSAGATGAAASTSKPRASAGVRESAGAATTPPAATPAAQARLAPERWPQVLDQLELNGAMRAVANLLALTAVDDARLEFRASRDDIGLVSERFKASLARALEGWCGFRPQLQFRAAPDDQTLVTPAKLRDDRAAQAHAEAEAALAGDPAVKRLQSTFDAEILPGSVRPAEAGDAQEHSRRQR